MVSNPYTIIQFLFPLSFTGCCQFDIYHLETLFHYIYWQKNLFKYLLMICSPLRHSDCIGFCQTLIYSLSPYLNQKCRNMHFTGICSHVLFLLHLEFLQVQNSRSQYEWKHRYIFTSRRHNLRYQERVSLGEMFAKKPFPVHSNILYIYTI